jgi:predicted nucleic acid-binding protein
MIHLDTNYLIGLTDKGSAIALEVETWLAAGEAFAASAVAWSEFLNGPVTPFEVSQVEAILESRIIPFEKAEAVLAAKLFNDTGRRRGSRFDCLIAATAMLAQTEVATVNQSDFKAFLAHGLKLAAPLLPSPTQTAS